MNKYFNIIGSEKISVKNVINLISKKIGVKKIIYHKRKFPDHHYKINPFTYKVREGKFIKIKNGKHLCGIECAKDVNIVFKKFIDQNNVQT